MVASMTVTALWDIHRDYTLFVPEGFNLHPVVNFFYKIVMKSEIMGFSFLM
jgi:hypothetical protein